MKFLSKRKPKIAIFWILPRMNLLNSFIYILKHTIVDILRPLVDLDISIITGYYPNTLDMIKSMNTSAYSKVITFILDPEAIETLRMNPLPKSKKFVIFDLSLVMTTDLNQVLYNKLKGIYLLMYFFFADIIDCDVSMKTEDYATFRSNTSILHKTIMDFVPNRFFYNTGDIANSLYHHKNKFLIELFEDATNLVHPANFLRSIATFGDYSSICSASDLYTDTNNDMIIYTAPVDQEHIDAVMLCIYVLQTLTKRTIETFTGKNKCVFIDTRSHNKVFMAYTIGCNPKLELNSDVVLGDTGFNKTLSNSNNSSIFRNPYDPIDLNIDATTRLHIQRAFVNANINQILGKDFKIIK